MCTHYAKRCHSLRQLMSFLQSGWNGTVEQWSIYWKFFFFHFLLQLDFFLFIGNSFIGIFFYCDIAIYAAWNNKAFFFKRLCFLCAKSIYLIYFAGSNVPCQSYLSVFQNNAFWSKVLSFFVNTLYSLLGMVHLATRSFCPTLFLLNINDAYSV